MDDMRQPGPPLEEAELIERIKLSIAEAERGDVVSTAEVLAKAWAEFSTRFPNSKANLKYKAS
jgi:hypothetical protein